MCIVIETNLRPTSTGWPCPADKGRELVAGSRKRNRANRQLATATIVVMVAIVMPVEIPAGPIIVPATVVVTSAIRSVKITTSVPSTAVMVMGLG